MGVQGTPDFAQWPWNGPGLGFVFGNDAKQMSLLTRTLIIHEAVSSVHHTKIVESKKISSLEADLDCKFCRQGLHDVKRLKLLWRQRRQKAWSWSCGSARDPHPGAIHQDAPIACGTLDDGHVSSPCIDRKALPLLTPDKAGASRAATARPRWSWRPTGR